MPNTVTAVKELILVMLDDNEGNLKSWTDVLFLSMDKGRAILSG